MSRIATRFAALRDTNRPAFVPFVTAGDPDSATSLEILKRLPKAGADLIEVGVPFSDPMADGPAIQAASQRALKKGMTLARVLELVSDFRATDRKTPLVLMGYYNPIHAIGVSKFVAMAGRAGVDGLITVDLPPEEDEAFRAAATTNGIDVIRLATPTTDDARLAVILNGASGFLYYVSIAGVTGTKSFSRDNVEHALAAIRRRTQIPVAVGFGIKTPDEAAEIARIADGAVVGSAIVRRIAELAPLSGPALVEEIAGFCASLASAVHASRSQAVVD